jgi:uncharacterized protein YqgV (UPF0045/DUF77 family)
MGTIIQGPLDRILELARKMHEAPFAMGAKRVMTTINIDDRRDKIATTENKVRAASDKTVNLNLRSYYGCSHHNPL